MNDHSCIKIWHGRIDADAANAAEYWPMLSSSEQERAASIGNLLQRQRFIFVRGRLRLKLSQYVDLPPSQLKIELNPYGKPFLADFSDVDFNLSHTADQLVIAAGRNSRVGIDIETYRPRKGLNDLVARCFADVEANWWRAQAESAKIPAFYRLWTRKEAFVKATGFGISLGLDRCIVDPENPDSWLSVPGACGTAADWHSYAFEPEQNDCIALVTNRMGADIQWTAL